jgi:hypothetical protein
MMNNETSPDKDVNSIKIKPFPGPVHQSHKHAWPTWHPHVIGCARDSGPGIAGHAGLILSAAEYQRRFALVFQAKVMPGALALDADADVRAAHLLETADYLKEERFVKLFRNKLLMAIDEEAQTACGTGEMLADMHPRDLLGLLEGLFGRVSSTELLMEAAKLTVPISYPHEWLPLIGLHLTVHRLHELNHQALGENQRIELLKEAITPIGYFEYEIRKFESEHPLGDIGRTYHAFVTQMNIAHSQIREDRPPPSSSLFAKRTQQDAGITVTNNFVRRRHPYAGSVLEIPHVDTSDPLPTGTSEYEVMKAMLIKEIKASLGGQPRKERLLNHYCHTHGTGNHDSRSCKRPKEGHILTATAKNKMGGSENVYKKRK